MLLQTLIRVTDYFTKVELFVLRIKMANFEVEKYFATIIKLLRKEIDFNYSITMVVLDPQIMKFIEVKIEFVEVVTQKKLDCFGVVAIQIKTLSFIIGLIQK